MRRGSRLSGRQRGIALPAVLLVTLALAVMAHAAVVVAGTESAVARMDAGRVTRDRQAAAALAALELAAEELPPAGVTWQASVRVAISRLSPETALMVARGAGPPGTVLGAGRARILWAPDPGTRLAGRTAGLQVAGGVAVAAGAVVGPSPDPAPCPAGSGPPVPGPVWALPNPGGVHPGLGPVPIQELIDRLGPRPPGELALDSAMEAGVRGDLRIRGAGSGVLAVAGTLTLEPGTRMEGWLWVEGDLVIRGDARLEGIADVGGVIQVETGGTVQSDPCLAAGLLAGAAALRRPWGVGPLAWPAS